MGHVMRSVVQLFKDPCRMQHWAMKWFALYHREQQSALYAKASLNWHQLCVIDKSGKTNGITQLLPEAMQTSWHAVNDLKRTDPTVTGVIGQSDNARSHHSLGLML